MNPAAHSTIHSVSGEGPRRRSIPHLRWWIGGLLFTSTVINYIDRQTLSALAPFLQRDFHWNNADFATILIAFRLAYTLMQGAGGRMLDRLGTRRGLSLTVTFYSAVACLTASAQGIGGFRIFRFLLGAGEGANWPGATKAVSEWFPARERAWAVAMFDSGSSIGGAVAPFLVLFLYHYFGTWRPAFLLTGCLGFLWLLVWRVVYRTPEEHPRLSAEELNYIQQGRVSAGDDAATAAATTGLPPAGWRQLLRYRQTWGIILGRFLLDPYWFLVADWFAIYLARKGFPLEQSVLGFWAPFLAADFGNFFGGGLSSYWIRKGWPVGKSRRAVLLIFGPSMLLLIPAAFATNYAAIILLFAYSTFAYAACSIWDLFHAGKKNEARELFMRFLLAAVLERRTGYVLQKEILRRRGIFKTVVMRSTRRFSMDADDLRELDGILELLRPSYRV